MITHYRGDSTDVSTTLYMLLGHCIVSTALSHRVKMKKATLSIIISAITTLKALEAIVNGP